MIPKRKDVGVREGPRGIWRKRAAVQVELRAGLLFPVGSDPEACAVSRTSPRGPSVPRGLGSPRSPAGVETM